MLRKVFIVLCLVLPAVFVVPAVAQAQLPDFTELVEKQGPAVVNISTTQGGARNPLAQQMPNVPEDDPFFEFFRRFAPNTPGQPREFQSQSLGSGFVISADGYIMTNAHVVASADEITVRLTDKREFKAKVIGSDRRTDVALIKIEASGLPVVKFGDPAKLKVGEWVVAIGSPFGFDNTVTKGIVSAKGRSLPQENFVPFIQTDVAVNPGNSGGPLFNMRGEVVGINSQIYSRTGGYMGLSFAIPIEVAMKVKDDLQKYGKVSRGRLGVNVQPLTKELAESFGMSSAQGALVSAVEPNSAAARAGIEAGDVVVAVNETAIEQPADLVRAVGETRPGSSIALKVWRQGKLRELTAKVGEAPSEKTAAIEESGSASPKLGLTVRPLSGEERQQLGGRGGLLVEDVEGPAAAAGLARGDVILSINGRAVTSADDSIRTLEQITSGRIARLIVWRAGSEQLVTMRKK